MYNFAERYAKSMGKTVESLEFHDFVVVGQAVGQDPNQCMKKIVEIVANGTLRPGVWKDSED
jgi:hypothetical protein